MTQADSGPQTPPMSRHRTQATSAEISICIRLYALEEVARWRENPRTAKSFADRIVTIHANKKWTDVHRRIVGEIEGTAARAMGPGSFLEFTLKAFILYRVTDPIDLDSEETFNFLVKAVASAPFKVINIHVLQKVSVVHVATAIFG